MKSVNLSLIFLFVLLGAVFPAGKIFALNEANFFLSPSTGNLNINGTISVDLRINSSVGITSIKAYLDFPPSLLSVVSIDTIGSVFNSWWENIFNNITGKIQLQASSPIPGFSGTSGLIAKINFRAIAAGTANVTYDAVSLALRPDDTNSLNLAGSSGATFTISTIISPDTTAPAVSNGQPSGALTAGTTQTTISVTATDSTPPVNCRYSTVANTPYVSMTGTMTASGTTYSAAVSGLSNGNTYNYYIRCQDSVTPANANTADFPITFSVASVSASALSVSLSASPSSGQAPLNDVDLTADVSGTATGAINYTFYCNRPDSGVNLTSPWQMTYNTTTIDPLTSSDICDYPSAGTYIAKVIVSRGAASPAESRITIVVSSPSPPAPDDGGGGGVGGGGGGGGGGDGGGGVVAPLIGDFNSDGKVNIFDFSMLLSNWGSSTAKYDLNKDSKVSIFDLSIFLSNWTK